VEKVKQRNLTETEDIDSLEMEARNKTYQNIIKFNGNLLMPLDSNKNLSPKTIQIISEFLKSEPSKRLSASEFLLKLKQN
jgi:hypothetical protein